MQVSYFETGRYYAPSNLPRQWPMPAGARSPGRHAQRLARPPSTLRSGLAAGGSEIRTLGPSARVGLRTDSHKTLWGAIYQ